MHSLGFTTDHGEYAVQCGDIGRFIGGRVAALNPKTSRIVQINILTIEPLERTNIEDNIKAGRYTQAEIESFDSGKEVQSRGQKKGKAIRLICPDAPPLLTVFSAPS